MASRAPEGSSVEIRRRPLVLPFGRLPGWARAADWVFVLLMIAATAVAVSGGGRMWVGDWRVSITSPYRLVAWAAAVALLRHGFARQQPIHRQLPSALRSGISSSAFRAAAATFVGTRLIVFVTGFVAVAAIGYPAGAPPPEFRDGAGPLAALPLRWDAGWYLQVARDGYQYSQRIGTEGQQNVVFFPAFPVATRVVALLLGGTEGSYVLAATLVSLTAFFGALIYVYLIARRHLAEDEAQASLWLLAAFPFAYFYGAIYTESLFLLGAAGAFHHAREQQYLRAGAWGLLVGLTKPNGFLLSVSLALMALSPPADRVLRRQTRQRAGLPLMMVAMPVAGVLIFSGYLRQLTGSPLAWVDGHAAWGRQYTGLGVLLTDRYQWIMNEGFVGYVSKNPLDFLNAVAVVFVLATVWPVSRRLGAAYGVFMLMHSLPPLAHGGLLSSGRLVSVLFPAFIWFAGAVPAHHRTGWIVSFSALQALNASLFYTWRPLF